MTGTGTIVELTSGTDPGYSRVTFHPDVSLALVSGAWQNSSDIVFGPNTSDAGWTDEVTAVYCYDDSTAGDLIWSYVLATAVTVGAGSALRIPTGDLVIDWP
jgi:hypothetical protein